MKAFPFIWARQATFIRDYSLGTPDNSAGRGRAGGGPRSPVRIQGGGEWRAMPEFIKPFLRYWSLTLAVFVIYFFAFLAAIVDIVVDLQEHARKKRAAAPPVTGPVLDPNPLKGKTIAQTFQSPGQRLDAKRQWEIG